MQYDLVFEGGGAKGMVFVGAMQEFEQRGHTHGRLLGTSAGAITACLLAAGYTSGEMLKALKEKADGKSVFTKFMGAIPPVDKELIRKSSVRSLLKAINARIIPDPLEDMLDDRLAEMLANRPSFNHLYSFMEYGGWYAADAFLAWLRDKLDAGGRGYADLTLAAFCAATGVDLSLVASDTTAETMLVLNHRTAPDLPVAWAVRMSMSIPLLWQEVVWKKEWGAYQGEQITGHTIVDGGLLSNFPIELFLSNTRIVTALMGPRTSEYVLGMLIDETLSVSGAPIPRRAKKDPLFESLPAAKRVSSLVNTLLSAHDKMVIEAFKDFVVRLPAKGYGTTEFDMSDRRRAALVEAGRIAMQAYFIKQKKQISLQKVTPRPVSAQQAANSLAKQFIRRNMEPHHQ
ncbi:MAG: patatin-like phospholipase family protein [Anaerolineales bacterium]|nr:patatin-like phospholipase family protein [Anaerolineales bacterium]